ncbi:MAG: serine/threonine-protein kinase [Planctomycetota bacterium]
MGSDAVTSNRVRRLVAECVVALERGEADPTASVCAADPDLQKTVHRRLQRLRRLGLLGQQPQSVDDLRSFGAYAVQHRLGTGGMGSVWRAEQLEPVRRPVALKVLKLGMDSAEVLARFEAERRALAALNHPNIAKIFDAGLVPGGRPFFAMELIDGVAITTFARERRLDVRARVELLLPVCDAVTHAHRRGLIHRDLKPSNILVREVDGYGEPVVIDFGIAKALDSTDPGRTALTAQGSLLGTPEYMSPEQAGAVECPDVDSRTDVWSLGVVLYELLTGTLPIAIQSPPGPRVEELRRALRECDPAPPSSRVAPSTRRSVAGELDWIVLQALTTDRERRYGSVAELADDLRRHLRGEDVRAAPPSTLYRLRKALSRHRVAAALGSAVLLGLLLALGGIGIGLREARAQGQVASANFADALDAVDTLLVRASRLRLEDVPHAIEIEVAFRRDALDALERLLARNSASVDLRRRVAAATFELANGLFDLGQRREALAMAEAARDRSLGLRNDGLASAESETVLGKAYRLIADAQRRAGSGDLALANYRSALAVFASACARRPARTIDARLLASVHGRLAGEASAAGDARAERQHLDAAFAIREDLTELEPDHDEHLQALAATHHRYAMHFAAVGDLDAADAHAQQELALASSIADRDPSRDKRRAVCIALTFGAMIDLDRGRQAQAETGWRRAIELWAPLLEDYPNVPILAHESAQPAYYLAASLWDRWALEPDRVDEVADLARSAAAANRRARAADSVDARFTAQLARALDLLGHALRAADDPPPAELAAIDAELASLGEQPSMQAARDRHRRNAGMGARQRSPAIAPALQRLESDSFAERRSPRRVR